MALLFILFIEKPWIIQEISFFVKYSFSYSCTFLQQTGLLGKNYSYWFKISGIIEY